MSKAATWVRRALLVAAAMYAAAGPLASSVHAQSSNDQALMEQVNRLQRELSTLQLYVYRGEKPPESAIAEIYGSGGINQTQAARIDLRLSQLESELRGLTGQIEEQSFRIDRLTKRVDKLVADVDSRLQRLEQQTGGRPVASGGDLGASQGSLSGDGGQPGTLGTVSEDAVAAVRSGGQVEPGGAVPSGTAPATQAPTGQSAYALAGTTAEEKYSQAFNLLSQANYDQAEVALRTFLDEYPDHRLAGNAKYWLGETYYVRGQYQEAAVTFAEGYQTYPDSTKAPDNLLKLGKSLSALGETNDACGTYGELLRRFPSASPTVLKQADQERRRLACP
ncbi:MAG TPA: tol-pal system protein YbgF [Kiloniellales bacterium]